MDLPRSAAPRRRAPPQGRLCGRSPAISGRRGASLMAVAAGTPVSVACPRPRPKGTTAPGKPAPCVSRASPDRGRRPSTRRTVRLRRGRGAGGTHRQPSPTRPAVAACGISPRSRCGPPDPRQRDRPVHTPEPDVAGFAPRRSGPPRPTRALGTDRFRCYTANRVDSFIGHVPFPRGIPPARGVSLSAQSRARPSSPSPRSGFARPAGATAGIPYLSRKMSAWAGNSWRKSLSNVARDSDWCRTTAAIHASVTRFPSRFPSISLFRSAGHS